jgi:hypothetical protein
MKRSTLSTQRSGHNTYPCASKDGRGHAWRGPRHGGALEEHTYRQLLAEAGFAEIGVEVTRVYQAQELAASDCCDSLASERSFAELAASGSRLVSAFVRATKPGSS